jgi:sterol 14-demethylase
VIDAFDTIYKLFFQLLSRVVGATEVAEDPQLSSKMLSIFETFERSNSTAGIIFPWLRVFTPAYILRMVLGTVLYLSFRRIIVERKRTGRREDDALQHLLDQDTPLDTIIKVPLFFPLPSAAKLY